jgi:hypothetical protein
MAIACFSFEKLNIQNAGMIPGNQKPGLRHEMMSL